MGDISEVWESDAVLEMKDRQGHLRGSGKRETVEGTAGVSFRKKVLSKTLKKKLI